MRLFLVFALSVLLVGSASGQNLKSFEDLVPQTALPDPLVTLDGKRLETADDWSRTGRPALIHAFQHYVYGYLPAAPARIETEVLRVDKNSLGGKATKKEVVIRYDPDGKHPLHLLLVVPNRRNGPAPVVVGPNFCGNHTLLEDTTIALAEGWIYDNCPGVVDNRATAAGRGSAAASWSIDYAIRRGYAVATFYNGDVDPDTPDFSDGIEPLYWKEGRGNTPGPHDFGMIGAIAYGISRAVDYLSTDPDIDADRIIVFGHSRNGKAALLAGALDERIDLVIPHQSGTGGAALNRKTVGETVKQINDRFPHWFSGAYARFNDEIERLPIDQHELIALVAPRPILLTNAVDDQWADPAGQFRALQAAEPVYQLMGTDGLEADTMPKPGKLVGSTQGYFIRPGKHSTLPEDWKVFLDFADRRLK